MNIGKSLGRLFGRSKKKKNDTISNDGTMSEEEKPRRCGFQEFSTLKDPFDENLKIRTIQPDLPTFRTRNSNTFSDDMPSASQIKRILLEADRAHKLWKIKRRLKGLGLEPSNELLSIELDQRGPHKWDHIMHCPILERYIYAVQYVRSLAAKEAKLSGHDVVITSETADEDLIKVYKKYRLDFTLNSQGEPSNISVGEDSSSSSQSDEESEELVAKESSYWLSKSRKGSNDDRVDSLITMYPNSMNRKFPSPASSINVMKTMNIDVSSEQKCMEELSSSDESTETTWPTYSKASNKSNSTNKIIPCIEVNNFSGSFKSSTITSFEDSQISVDSNHEDDEIEMTASRDNLPYREILDISKNRDHYLKQSSLESMEDFI